MSPPDIFNLKQQLVQYGAYHHNKVNVAIHMVFVPTIFWSAMVFAAQGGPLMQSSSLPPALHFLEPFNLDAGFFTTMFYIVYYAILDPVAASLCAPVLMGLTYTAAQFEKTNPHASAIALAVHVISWIFQFIGHGVAEKRKPRLMDNLVQALVSAPYFVFFEVLFALGYRPALYKEVTAEIDKAITAFRNEDGKPKSS